MSKIEQTIAEIEEYIDSCKFQPLSNSKIIVNRNEIDELIDDLRRNIPDEIKKYQRIIANRDAILKDAQDKAEEMIKKANEMTSTLVSEHEIMQQAYKEASIVLQNANEEAARIIESANNDATALRTAANDYLDDSLGDIQNILNTTIENMMVKYDDIIRSLEASLEVTTRNRKSLHPEVVVPVEEVQPAAEDNYSDMSIEDALDQVDLGAEVGSAGDMGGISLM